MRLKRERLISFWRTYQRKEPFKAKGEKAAPLGRGVTAKAIWWEQQRKTG